MDIGSWICDEALPFVGKVLKWSGLTLGVGIGAALYLNSMHQSAAKESLDSWWTASSREHEANQADYGYRSPPYQTPAQPAANMYGGVGGYPGYTPFR